MSIVYAATMVSEQGFELCAIGLGRAGPVTV